MTYYKLSDELILRTINYMRGSDIDNFIRVNKRTYNISFSSKSAERRRSDNRNARAILSRFKLPAVEETSLGCIARTFPDESEDVKTAIGRLEYLDLNEDLHWLQPLDPKTAKEWKQYYGDVEELHPEDRAAVENLTALAQDLKLTVPQSFFTFLKSTELQSRVANSCSSYFELGALHRFNGPVPGQPQGYAVRFYTDQQSCYFWCLYLDDAGHHCVIGSDDDIGTEDENEYMGGEERDETVEEEENKEETASDKHMPNPPIPDRTDKLPIASENQASLCSIHFESFLARVYFEQWIEMRDRSDSKLDPRPREFLEKSGPLSNNFQEILDNDRRMT